MSRSLPIGGFTLVEVTVAIVVTSIMIITITSFMLTNLEQSTIDTARATILNETEASLDLAANDIRLSANADANNRWPDPNGPDGTANEYSWASNSDSPDSTLVLATAAEDSSGNVIFADPKNYITEKNNLVYFVQNGTLYKRVIADPVSGNAAETTCPAAAASSSCPADTELLHNVTEFTVTYLNNQNQSVSPTDARSIQLQVAVSRSVFQRTITANYTTRMAFRND